ncbi:MAG: DUF975 family protein [Lachnospiraceae bacterium]|nr:DUF975 family protein [Lachnospiraceae bacterium]
MKAKDQLLGNYGIAAGSFALYFVIVYSLIIIIMSAYTVGIGAGNAADNLSSGWSIITQALGIVIGIISMLFAVGYVNIIRKIADGERPPVSELFYVFRNHPDKVIIISVIMMGAQFILMLPAGFIASSVFADGKDAAFDGKMFFWWVVAYLAGFLISVAIDLMISMSFMIYLDDPDAGVGEILTKSISMMKGNKLRLLYLSLSFIGYWVLLMLSLGIASLWIVPYQTMATLEFYRDLRGQYAEAEYL